MELTGTTTTPGVKIDPQLGILEIIGRSSPESSVAFYAPILDKLKSERFLSPKLKVDIRLEYFNTSSCKCILDIFKVLREKHSRNHQINVNWLVDEEDEDLIEVGEDIEEVSRLKFNYIFL